MEKDLVEAKIAYNEWLRRGGDSDEAWKDIYRLTKKKIPNSRVDRWRWYLHNNYDYFHPEYGKVLWFDSKSRAVLMCCGATPLSTAIIVTKYAKNTP